METRIDKGRVKSWEMNVKKLTPEELFYDNLTLGLPRILANVPRICGVAIEKRLPCEKAQVLNWEQRHCVYLPEDMKKFYLSTDGFILHWSYEYDPDEIQRVGYIHFPHLLQITLLRENIESSPTPSAASVPSSDPGPSCSMAMQPSTSAAAAAAAAAAKDKCDKWERWDKWGHPLPVLTPKTKIFELNNVNDVAKVCLVYESTNTSNPKIYLFELETLKWQFLADTFTEYLRMAVAHLGLPYWELCFSSFGLPPWAQQLFLVLAPHLLEEQPRRKKFVSPQCEAPHNTIDPSIFRQTKPKSQKSVVSEKAVVKHGLSRAAKK